MNRKLDCHTITDPDHLLEADRAVIRSDEDGEEGSEAEEMVRRSGGRMYG